MKEVDPPPKSGSTSVRRAFWNQALAAVMAAQKKDGRNVTVSEHQGRGTFINIGDTSQRRGGGGVGACCYDDGTCDDLTEADCTEAGGNWQGPGTTCDDDPSPCVGACCIDGECSILSESDCIDAGGEFQGLGTTCDPNPCIACPVNVHAAICFRWYPVGFPPDVDCIVTVSEELDIPVEVSPCPIDYTETGAKFGFDGLLTSAVNSGTDCPTPMLGASHFGSVSDLFWDADAGEWTISLKIVFPGWPATFTYGPVIVAVEDLTTAGPITFASDDCPAPCESAEDCTNPVQSIVIEFS